MAILTRHPRLVNRPARLLFRKLGTLVTAMGDLDNGRGMKMKAVSGTKVTLLFAGMLTLALGILLAKASPVQRFDYPLVVDGTELHVIVETNSTISNFEAFSEDKKIAFVVDGATDTPGFCNVTIPFRLLGGPYLVWFDGEIMWFDKQETTNDTHVFLYFTYLHSPHTVEITGTTWGSPAKAPVAHFFPSNATPSAGDKVFFDASASYDPDGTIESWSWSFGDGTTDTGEIVDHTYASAGNFTVTLTVIDDEGLSKTAKTDIVVLAAVRDVAITSVTVSPAKVKVGEPVSINVVVTNQGESSETFEVTVYYDDTEIKTEIIANLAPSNSKSMGINWETTDVDPGTYTIEAVAETVPDETETYDNYAANTVTITENDRSTVPSHYLVAAVAIAILLLVVSIAYFTKIRKTT